ncbi:uncharacterized protein CC84DRAFT_1153489 [Paraphaeosphaeria sporulosa]|uniref:Zn(2)-C6 fungal-type domain-containing protein n=1 Tax=Paraphaeosphaeria sporulosa TaxID=1460663 RepID=A0A177C445_9PLEO|nr:uncharacterized protein CC84DRAFT_1153489 [Paraphaeosphaeria sporulosa]OAG01568.1 hypothetical protein CC84DRAFT_1153489 [Paraphaeosphaeria sporulosa]
MSTRKPRIQSKHGCAQCRKRRIKCDEGRPDCKNCARRRAECSFRTYDPVPRSFLARAPQANGPSSSPEGSVASISSPTFLDYLPQDKLIVHFPDALRPRIRHLLQHFAEETSFTITHNDAARAAWCAAVPQLTAKHIFVLQGTVAISALHVSKHAETESEKKHFRDIATYQMNMGLIKYREAIARVSETNAESLLAFSVTATAWVLYTTTDDFQALLHPNEKRRGLNRDQTVKALVATTSKILRTLRGVLVILVPCWHLIVSGVFKDVAKRDWWPYAMPATSDAIEDDKRLKDIESMWMRPDRPYEYCFDALRQALKTLREDFARVSQLTVSDNAPKTRYGKLIDWTSVMSWPIQLPLAFLELVEARQPEAWVILAHYAVLPAQVEFVFWIKDFAPNLVSTAALVLGEQQRNSIEWPAQAVGVDLDQLYSIHRTET